MAAPLSTAAGPTARERILQTADRLFYSRGIHAVGMDRLVKEAGVTRATMYRHFPSKDTLVAAYMTERARREREAFDARIAEVTDPRQALRVLASGLIDDELATIDRGCPFINAAAEFEVGDNEMRAIAREHRAWFRGMCERLLRDAGHPDPPAAARLLLMIRTGAVVAGALDGPVDFRGEFLAACDHVVDGTWSLS